MLLGCAMKLWNSANRSYGKPSKLQYVGNEANAITLYKQKLKHTGKKVKRKKKVK